MVDLQELNAVEEKIRALAESALACGRPYMLSKLGNDLGPDLRVIRSIGASLADFIRTRLSHEYTIISTGQHNNIQALIRAGDTATADYVPPATNAGKAEPKPPRYHYRFWAAFSVPITAGTRYLDLQRLTFTDADQKPDGEFAVIEPDFVAPTDIEHRDPIILKNLEAWIKKNGLSPEQFLFKPREKENSPTKAPGSRSLLEAMIEALDRRQLSSTTLTLDVVAELLRKRV